MNKIVVEKKSRVGCFLDKETFIGWGYFLGCVKSQEGIGLNIGGLLGIDNPKIVLDSGEVIWGCECWWGSEKEIQSKIELLGGKMKSCTVAEMRKILYQTVPEDKRPIIERLEFEIKNTHRSSRRDK